MDQYECSSIGGVRKQGLQAFLKVRKIISPIGAFSFDIENVNKDAHVREHGRFLDRKVALLKAGLATAVPEIEKERTKETLVRLLDVNGSSKPMGKRRQRVLAVKLRRMSVLAGLYCAPTSHEGDDLSIRTR